MNESIHPILQQALAQFMGAQQRIAAGQLEQEKQAAIDAYTLLVNGSIGLWVSLSSDEREAITWCADVLWKRAQILSDRLKGAQS